MADGSGTVELQTKTTVVNEATKGSALTSMRVRLGVAIPVAIPAFTLVLLLELHPMLHHERAVIGFLDAHFLHLEVRIRMRHRRFGHRDGTHAAQSFTDFHVKLPPVELRGNASAA